jgi:predicted nucleic acid-binding protein
MIIVADSSPLISLAILSKLDLLTSLFDKIYIPKAVFSEISIEDKPFSNLFGRLKNIRIMDVNNKIALTILSKDLDLGESEAIVLAMENKIGNILMDEQKGRRIAIANGLHPIGTIGVLIQAKKMGLIDNVKSYLDVLIKNNIYISNKLYTYSLKIVEED